MSIATTKHLRTLESMIGSQIDFGVAPLLQVSDSVTYPCSECYGEQHGHFFESPLLNLRLRSDGSPQTKSWVTLRPGTDEPIKDGQEWGPLAAFESDEPQLPKNTQQIDPSIWDTNLQVDGFSRISLWTGVGKITRIELLSFPPYAAAVFSHASGAEWLLYAEYDFAFWFNFDCDLARIIQTNAENTYTIKAR